MDQRTCFAAAAAAAVVGGGAAHLYRQHRQQKQRAHTVFVDFPPSELVEDEAQIDLKIRHGLEYFTQHGKRSTVFGRDGVEIHYAEFTPASPALATLFFIPGWSECMNKYGDFFFELVEQHGIYVVVVDLRSNGYSGRVPVTKSQALNNHLKSHVQDFHDYITDCLLVLNRAVDLQSTRLFLAGFSMGGLVASELNKMIPASGGLILLAPCLHLPIPVLPRCVARYVASKLKSDEFVLGHPNALDHQLLMPPKNRGSQSLARVRLWQELRGGDERILITGMTWSQLHCLLTPEVEEADRSLLAKRVLVVSAELDHLVSNPAIFDYCERRRATATCRHVHFNQSKHGLLGEIEPIRNRVVQEVVSFMLW